MPDDRPLPPSIEHYTLEGILGEGAMGVVYRARDVAGKVVAIKTIKLDTANASDSRELFERFRREGIAGAQLIHRNIVRVHGYGETADLAYIVMDFVAGESLKALNARKGRWPLFEALDLAYQLLEALDYFHMRGIVHRDIKPSNLMVGVDNHLTVTDFGIARVHNSTLTQVGTILGTPWYMSPEQITEQALDGRADLFSVGIILYELITGINPFKADQLSKILDKIVVEPHQPPSAVVPGLPAAIDKLFERALAKKPQDRFQNGGEFRVALRQMLTEVLPERSNTSGWKKDAPEASDPPKPKTLPTTPDVILSPPRQRSYTTIWIVAGVIVSGLTLMVWSASSSGPKPESKIISRTVIHEPPQPTPITTPTQPAQDQENDPLLAEITRQCDAPQIERVLIPDVNGFVRCAKQPLCTWDAEAIHAMHRRLSTDVSPAYLAEIGCTAGLHKTPG